MLHTPPSAPVSLIGLSADALKDAMTRIGEKPFRAKQLWHWMYGLGATSFDVMTNFSMQSRTKLAQHYHVKRPEIVSFQESIDGTRKWLLKLADGHTIETVFIPEDDRGTVCVSSQVGCAMACTFCHTGTQKIVRNLDAGEIVSQVLLVRDSYNEWPTPRDGRMVSNIVFMGMGEPLLNYHSVVDAIAILSDSSGLGLSRRRITVSTSGIVPFIAKLGADTGVSLAISLHAPTDSLRDTLMPINKKYPLPILMDAVRAYPSLANARRITFEYVMLKDINDSLHHAAALSKLVAGIPCKFNLIPFNPWPGSSYVPSEPSVIQAFSEFLNDKGYAAPIRRPRGDDILAACGQLKTSAARLKIPSIT